MDRHPSGDLLAMHVRGDYAEKAAVREARMKLGIIADTHDNLSSIRRALDCFRERGVEAVIHAGDMVAPFAAKALAEFPGPVYVVYGNCDGERAGLAKVLDVVPSPRTVELGGLKILVAHDAGEIPEERAAAADVVVTGHTHEVSVSVGSSQSGTGEAGRKRPGRPLRLNPGEACGAVNGRPTCIVLDTETLAAEVVELAKIA